MNLVEICKICGILFFMFMFWYFIFVVFKSNNEFLKSLVGLNKNVVEGFTGDALTKLENMLAFQETVLKRTLETLQLSEKGDEEQRRLCLNILKTAQRSVNLQITQAMLGGKNIKAAQYRDLLTMREAVKIAKETYVRETLGKGEEEEEEEGGGMGIGW